MVISTVFAMQLGSSQYWTSQAEAQGAAKALQEITTSIGPNVPFSSATRRCAHTNYTHRTNLSGVHGFVFSRAAVGGGGDQGAGEGESVQAMRVPTEGETNLNILRNPDVTFSS